VNDDAVNLEVELACADVDDHALDASAATLSEPERRRLAELRRPADRRRFVVARALLRRRLGERLGCDPRSVEIVIDDRGKPSCPQGGPCFNLSHAGDFVVLAWGPRPIGVDLEAQRMIDDPVKTARRFFAPPEVERVVRAADRTDEFLRIWTAKEAVVKAVGGGLANALAEFEIPVASSSPQPVRVLGGDPSLAVWSVATFVAPPGYYGAVAARGGDWDVVMRRDGM
jgi:4'-phosphopantetheinyl transferase